MKPGAEGPVVVRQDAVDDDHFICTCPQTNPVFFTSCASVGGGGGGGGAAGAGSGVSVRGIWHWPHRSKE